MRRLFLPVTVFVFTAFFISCTKPSASDPRTELITASGDPGASAFYYATNEDENQTTHSLTNKEVNKLITLGKNDKGLVLRYTSINEKKSNTTTLYKSELTRKDNSVSLVVTDMTSLKTVLEKIFQDDNQNPPDTTSAGFDSLEECIADFNCKHKGELQCAANRTCENQYGAMICCLKNGQCFSVHVIITPNTWRCHFRDLIPDLEGLVFSKG